MDRAEPGLSVQDSHARRLISEAAAGSVPFTAAASGPEGAQETFVERKKVDQ